MEKENIQAAITEGGERNGIEVYYSKSERPGWGLWKNTDNELSILSSVELS